MPKGIQLMSQNKHQIKSINNIRKEQIFEMYVLWKSLPSFYKGKSEESLKQLGFDDDNVLELLVIKNQKDFATKYKITQETLSRDWNKIIEDGNLVREKRKEWGKKLGGNVLILLYQGIIKEKDAARVKLFFQLVDDWVEKQQHEIKDEPLAQLLREIHEQRQPIVKSSDNPTKPNEPAGTEAKPQEPLVASQQHLLDQK